MEVLLLVLETYVVEHFGDVPRQAHTVKSKLVDDRGEMRIEGKSRQEDVIEQDVLAEASKMTDTPCIGR